MRLDRATDIALRVLMLTAADGGRLTIDDLATALDVRRSHLAKVVQRLHRLGALDTTRGRGGGVGLAGGAGALSIGVLVRALEDDAEVVECDEPVCPLRSGCRLRGALRRAQEAFYTSLDAVTVTDLTEPPTREILLSLGRP